MNLSEITSIKIECLEELLHNNEIGILSKKVILKEIEKLKNYYKGLIDLEDYFEEEDDDDDEEWDDDDDYWDDDDDEWED